MERQNELFSSSALKRWILILFMIFVTILTYSQKIGVKTNLLYDATTTPNLGFEFSLSPRWTLDLSGGYNPWILNKDKNKKIKHFIVMPEARYWFCEHFQGHFLGIHSGYSQYNISSVRLPFQSKSTRYHRYQGWGTGIGLAYGYSWILGKRWNLEASLGAGYIFTKYDKYDCITCGKFKGKEKHHYLGPTKAGLSIIYMIK